MTRYESCELKETAIQLKICSILYVWICLFPFSFISDENRKEAAEFVKRHIIIKYPHVGSQLIHGLQRSMHSFSETKQLGLAKHELLFKFPFSAMKLTLFNHNFVAEQFCLIESSMLKNLEVLLPFVSSSACHRLISFSMISHIGI